MKSKVFSISIHNYPDRQVVSVYRTIGRIPGGGVKFYRLTVPRLIRLLRVMVNVSTRTQCYTYENENTSTWTIAAVVPEMYAAQAALATV